MHDVETWATTKCRENRLDSNEVRMRGATKKYWIRDELEREMIHECRTSGKQDDREIAEDVPTYQEERRGALAEKDARCTYTRK